MSTVFVTELVVLSRLSGRCFRFLQLLSTEFMANPPRPQWGLQYHLCHRNSTNLSLLSEALSLFLPGAALNIALTTQRALSQYFGTSTWIPVFSVCCCCYSVVSCVWLFTTPWTAACQASLSFIISWSLLKLMSIESGMLSNHLILCHPLFLLPSISPSIKVFYESALRTGWPKYWSVSVSLSMENSGLISFGIDWFNLLAVQGTLKSLLQHHNSKAPILQCSAFFMVQLSHLYMTNG